MKRFKLPIPVGLKELEVLGLTIGVKTDIGSQSLRLGDYTIPVSDELVAKIIDELENKQEFIDMVQAEYENQKKYIKETNKRIKEAPKKTPKSGYIYLIKSRDLYKIGRTISPRSRFKTYRTENPHGIELIHQFQSADYINAEAELLEKFAIKKVKNEWFSLNKKDVQFIKSL